MIGVQAIDTAWLAAHPLPSHEGGVDKNARGRVLLVGGAEFVPGALRLTGEAVLRAGAGKLQMATVRAAAMSLGVLVPEAAMIALPASKDGEIACEAADLLIDAVGQCDTAILGPGCSRGAALDSCVGRLLARPRDGLSIVLDAGAIANSPDFDAAVAAHDGRVVLTPHHGEMAGFTGRPIEEIAADPEGAALEAARTLNAIVVLKSADTRIATPGGDLLGYGSDCPGLATGGFGDVLAGIIGGLMSRGAAPVVAAGWGVWLHGQAGARLSEKLGPLGFLARDLLIEIPGLMASR